METNEIPRLFFFTSRCQLMLIHGCLPRRGKIPENSFAVVINSTAQLKCSKDLLCYHSTSFSDAITNPAWIKISGHSFRRKGGVIRAGSARARKRYSSVTMLWARWLRKEVRFPTSSSSPKRADRFWESFSLLFNGSRRLYPLRLKKLKREANHLPSPNAGVKTREYIFLLSRRSSQPAAWLSTGILPSSLPQ